MEKENPNQPKNEQVSDSSGETKGLTSHKHDVVKIVKHLSIHLVCSEVEAKKKNLQLTD